MNTAFSQIAPFVPEDIKILVFDVDDTLTRDTLDLKAEVWGGLFKDKLERLQEARELYEYTGNGDRYNIIAHIIDEPQDGCKTNEKVVVCAQEFERMTMERIRDRGLHADDIEALVYLRTRFEGNMYVLSATPQQAVEGNIRYFMDKYTALNTIFIKIIGTPLDGGKAGELTKLSQAQAVLPNEILMVGDGGSDYNGAVGAGTQFVGIVPKGKDDKWPDENFPKCMSVADLRNML